MRNTPVKCKNIVPPSQASRYADLCPLSPTIHRELRDAVASMVNSHQYGGQQHLTSEGLKQTDTNMHHKRGEDSQRSRNPTKISKSSKSYESNTHMSISKGQIAKVCPADSSDSISLTVSEDQQQSNIDSSLTSEAITPVRISALISEHTSDSKIMHVTNFGIPSTAAERRLLNVLWKKSTKDSAPLTSAYLAPDRLQQQDFHEQNFSHFIRSSSQSELRNPKQCHSIRTQDLERLGKRSVREGIHDFLDSTAISLPSHELQFSSKFLSSQVRLEGSHRQVCSSTSSKNSNDGIRRSYSRSHDGSRKWTDNEIIHQQFGENDLNGSLSPLPNCYMFSKERVRKDCSPAHDVNGTMSGMLMEEIADEPATMPWTPPVLTYRTKDIPEKALKQLGIIYSPSGPMKSSENLAPIDQMQAGMKGLKSLKKLVSRWKVGGDDTKCSCGDNMDNRLVK